VALAVIDCRHFGTPDCAHQKCFDVQAFGHPRDESRRVVASDNSARVVDRITTYFVC
jgi:hypothetical protein